MKKNEVLKYRKEQEEKKRKQNEVEKAKREKEELENVLTHKTYEKPKENKAKNILIIKGIVDLLIFISIILSLVLVFIMILNLPGASDIALGIDSLSEESDTIFKAVLVSLLVLKIILDIKLWLIIDPNGVGPIFFIFLDVITIGIYPLACASKKIKESKGQYILYKEQQRQIRAMIASSNNKYIERIKTEFTELLKKTEKLKTENYIVKRIKISEIESNLYVNLKSLVKNVTSKIEKETGFNAIVQIYKFEHYNESKANTIYKYDLVRTDPLEPDKHMKTEEITVAEGESPHYIDRCDIDRRLIGMRTEYEYYGLIKEEYIMDIVVGIEKYDKPYYGDGLTVKTNFIFTSEEKK